MPVGIAEVEPASLMVMVDLVVLETPWAAPVRDALVLDALEDGIELRVGGDEREVEAGEVRSTLVEIDRQMLVDLHGRKVSPGSFVFKSEDSSKPAGGLFLVVRRDDRVIQMERHGYAPVGADSGIVNRLRLLP